MRDEYDLSKLKNGVRGKHHDEYHAGTNLVLLQPDVAEEFPDADSVNEAIDGGVSDKHITVGHLYSMR